MLKEKVLETIKIYNLIENGDRIVVGVSGGPDSICLVNILNDIRNDKELNFDLIVCHINHMIRDEADSDEEFVKEYCENKNIMFFSKKVDIIYMSKKNKIGTEEAGRIARYEFFKEILDKYNCQKIATAHTKCDNSETVLMNIIRGTGTSGLKGILAIRDKVYIKPLIKATREEIEQYCTKHNLNPRYDKTNNENVYTRNKVRNILIPLIKDEFNPNIIETLDRLSELAKVENDFLDEVTKNTYKKLVIKEEKEEIILNLKEFNKLHEVVKSRIIIYTIKKVLGTANGIGKVHINDIITMCHNNIGNKHLLPNKNIKIAVNRGKMYFFVIKKT